MRFTSRSIIFLFILSTLAVFFFGFNAGKYISNVQKPPMKVSVSPTPVTNTSLSITPAAQPLSFTRISVSECGVSFLLPSVFEKTSSASQEAEFKSEKETVMVNCKKEFVSGKLAELSEKNASSSGIIAGQKVRMFASDEASIWIFPNKESQNVFIQVSQALEDLIKETLQLQ